MTRTPREEWPTWLRDADTLWADVEITEAGRVIWHGGIWRGGVWHDGDWRGGDWRGGIWHDGIWHDGDWHDGDWRGGIWHGGIWHDGIWHDGIWRGGVWHDGDWRGGIWHGGIWHDGIWHDGIWRGGVWDGGDWRGGYDNPTRCMFPVSGDGENIRVGCKIYSVDEARALCEGGDLPDEAPARDSEAGRLLRAAVLAQIAWHEALQ